MTRWLLAQDAADDLDRLTRLVQHRAGEDLDQVGIADRHRERGHTAHCAPVSLTLPLVVLTGV